MKKERRYFHEVIGFNYRLTNITAIGLAQLEQLPAFIKERSRVTQQYQKSLAGKNCHFQESLLDTEPAPWLFSVLFESASERDRMISLLNENEMDNRRLFIPLHSMEIYATEKSFPVADKLSRNGLSLPTFPALTDDEIDRICELF